MNRAEISRWLHEVEQWPIRYVAPLCVLMLTFVAILDYVSGYEMFYFVFYLLAIFPAAWFVGFSYGTLIAVLSVTAWISTNIAAGAHYSSYIVPVWNALILFVFYLVVLGLLWRLKKFHRELEQRVRLRTESLASEVRQRIRLQRKLLEMSEREQRRIGRELHDGLCQHLTALAFTGYALSQKLEAEGSTVAATATRLVELTESSMEMTRSLSRGLNPVEIEVGRLADNFRELAERTAAHSKITCTFECPGKLPELELVVATHLYRIAQEATENALRHGKPSRINICLDQAVDEIVLTVSDNGSGLPENYRNGTGMGLHLMAYRAELIGASFHIETPASGGTRMTCALPQVDEMEMTA